jgi:ABC-type nitrate/sulfonate/bicarbonate transport system substrate-binding protein
VDVTYLFNICDFFGTVVTTKDGVNSLKDLEGRTLAAATGTTNYAMFSWFASKDGVDVGKIKLLNQTTAGLSTMAQTGRADAVELWEPAYSTLVSKNKNIRTINMNLNLWSQAFGTTDIPYLGMAAQAGWAKSNPEAVQALYDTYKDAADWVLSSPEEAGALIAKTIPSGDAGVIQKLIETNDASLKLHVAPASELAKGMKGVFEAGVQIGYLTKQPPDSIIYQGIKR